jgi:hypothetical protein
MVTRQNLPELLQRKAVAPKRFDALSATPFVNKSASYMDVLLEAGKWVRFEFRASQAAFKGRY